MFLDCYIRAYQHYNKEGYSSICSKENGCSVTLNQYGVLTENAASSVYCYCDAPSKNFMLVFVFTIIFFKSQNYVAKFTNTMMVIEKEKGGPQFMMVPNWDFTMIWITIQFMLVTTNYQQSMLIKVPIKIFLLTYKF